MNKAIFILGALAVVAMAPGDAQAQQTVKCQSRHHQQETCAADTRGGAYIARQISRAACVFDESWGYNRMGIWVNRGCRAEFLVDIPPNATPISASDALRICRNTVAARLAMTDPTIVRVDIYPVDSQAGRGVGWATSDGRAGSCRVDATGVVTGWRVDLT
ncbi:MAG TPA: DUF3011 domain-containing protein [Longimicrobium sp.]|nr:DUF3011 domain-containing protein [Longimicrobium sp.]